MPHPLTLSITSAICAVLFGFLSFWFEEAAGMLPLLAACGFMTSAVLLAMAARQRRRPHRVAQRAR